MKVSGEELDILTKWSSPWGYLAPSIPYYQFIPHLIIPINLTSLNNFNNILKTTSIIEGCLEKVEKKFQILEDEIIGNKFIGCGWFGVFFR